MGYRKDSRRNKNFQFQIISVTGRKSKGGKA